jgi:hypothetical protein
MTKPKKPQINSVENEVMAKITAGQVKMHPRAYYTLVTVLSVAVIAILAVALGYLISLASLWLRIQKAAGPAYGARQNLTTLVDNFPWWAVVLAVLTIVALAIVIKRVGAFYKIKLAYLVTAIIVVAAAAGYGLSYTQLPNTFKRHNQNVCAITDANCTTQVKGNRFGQQ